jgi:hypothetical protein
MYNAMSPVRPPVGSIISRPKFPFTHRGIYLGNYLGCDQVFENTPQNGQRLVSFAEFAQGQTVSVDRQASIPIYELVRRIQEALAGGRPYDFLTNNCDHAVTRVADGVASSMQVLGWGLVAVVAGVVVLTSSKA